MTTPPPRPHLIRRRSGNDVHFFCGLTVSESSSEPKPISEATRAELNAICPICVSAFMFAANLSHT